MKPCISHNWHWISLNKNSTMTWIASTYGIYTLTSKFVPTLDFSKPLLVFKQFKIAFCSFAPLAIDSSLTLATDSIYAFRQTYARAAVSSFDVEGPDVALEPTAVISGAAFLPSCGNIELDGRRSSGGGGRNMDFSWSVSSTGATSNLTVELDTLNSKS